MSEHHFVLSLPSSVSVSKMQWNPLNRLTSIRSLHSLSLSLSSVFIKCCLLTIKYNLVDLFLHIKLLFYGRLFHQT